MSGMKRSFVETGEGSKGGRAPPPCTRRKRDPLDTIRFKSLQDAPMISPYGFMLYTAIWSGAINIEPLFQFCSNIKSFALQAERQLVW